MSDFFGLDGKIAVVTGGSRGLGLNMCEAFLLAGCSQVYVSSRKQDACEQACQQLNELSNFKNLKGVAIPIAADASNQAGVDKLVKFVSSKTDKVDIVAANAGATWGAEFGSHPEKAFDKVIGLNVKGVFLTIQSFYPLLEKAGTVEDPSRVIITASVAGLRSGMSGGTYGYLSSKAAIIHLGKTLAVELGPSNITVNSLAPGFFPTKMSNGMLEAIGDEMVESNPLRRLGEPDDIYGAVTYLCSKAGRYLNGVVLPVDGGMHLSGKF